MLPENARDALLRWTKGHADAADFLQQMSEVARLADDIVDSDANRQRNVCWLLVRTLTVLPVNPFFVGHAAALGPLVNTIIVQWQQSDEYRKSDDPLRQVHGFVIREAVSQLVTAVASIVGGYDHALWAANDFFETCHAGSKETVGDWVKE